MSEVSLNQAMEHAMQLGKEAAALVTHQFPSPVAVVTQQSPYVCTLHTPDVLV